MTAPDVVTIPDVSASQLVGTETFPLTTGTLTLTTASSPASLLLNLDTLTIPFTASTSVLTNPSSPREYLITYPVSDLTATIKLTLPAGTELESTNLYNAALSFEQLLVDHGFLTTGLVADADDIAAAVKESASRTAERVRAYTQQRLEREQAEPEEESHFSDATKGAVGGMVSVTGKTAEVTGKVAGAVSGAARDVGEWVGEKLPAEKEGGKDGGKEGGNHGFVKEAAKQTVDATGVAAGGVVDGAGEVAKTIGEATSKIIENEHGPKAKELVDGGREAAGNVGKAVVDIATGTSAVWNAGEAGVGVARAGTKE